MTDVQAPSSDRAPWSFPALIAFRFSAACVALSLTPIIPRRAVSWIAATVLHVPAASFTMTGSGDKAVDWARALCVVIGAAVITGVWSIVDRRRSHYRPLLPWLRLVVRFSLATVLVNYGAMKVFPVQMPAPPLARLIEPFGQDPVQPLKSGIVRFTPTSTLSR
jgi:hypothetical protein